MFNILELIELKPRLFSNKTYGRLLNANLEDRIMIQLLNRSLDIYI